MLLGGFGFLSRMYGLSIDNLVEVEMVLADGRIVIANEEEHPGSCVCSPLAVSVLTICCFADLWWALRGAGPSLGIATRYKAKAFPVPVVFAGNLL
jgi:FAD/FMN-containing dehydrogenase